MPNVRPAHRTWTEKEDDLIRPFATEQRLSKHVVAGLAARLNRSFAAVGTRIQILRGRGNLVTPKPRRDQTISYERTPMQVLADRDARIEASYQQDLTGVIMGDPPKGYSALDRRGT